MCHEPFNSPAAFFDHALTRYRMALPTGARIDYRVQPNMRSLQSVPVFRVAKTARFPRRRSVARSKLASPVPAITVANDLAIRRALEGAGVAFIDENGSKVRDGISCPRSTTEFAQPLHESCGPLAHGGRRERAQEFYGRKPPLAAALPRRAATRRRRSRRSLSRRFRSSTPSSFWNARSTACRPRGAWPRAAKTSRRWSMTSSSG